MARILIADDSSLMRKALKNILESIGHTIIGESDNGEDAYNKYLKLRPDLLTLDIEMPGMNGIETAKKIIKDFSDAKIIIITSSDKKENVMKAAKEGVVHYVLKPISPDRVIKKVNSLIGLNQTLSEKNKENDNLEILKIIKNKEVYNYDILNIEDENDLNIIISSLNNLKYFEKKDKKILICIKNEEIKEEYIEKINLIIEELKKIDINLFFK